MGRLRSLLEDLRGSYWLLPSLMALAAAGAAIGLVGLDRQVSTSTLEGLTGITPTNPEGTRAILTTIIGSIITVTGVVFSITVVALTLASSQFGPRLLRNFLRDRTNQVAFGTFVATFLYALIVLRSVTDAEVPHVASTGAVVLAITSLFVLIYFIHHTATSIQASSIIASVADEIEHHIHHLFMDDDDSRDDQDELVDDIDAVRRRVTRDGISVASEVDGFVRVVDERAATRLASENDLEVVLDRRPGDFVIAGTPLARVGPAERISDEVRKDVRNAFVVGSHRSSAQDLLFLVGQLTEIAVRALSPGINDPRTATECVHRLGAVVCRAARRPMPVGATRDREGRVRIVAPALSFADVVGACLDPLRRYGAPHVEVVLALYEVLGRAATMCHDTGRRQVLVEHAHRLLAAYKEQGSASEADAEQIDTSFREAMRMLTGNDRPEASLRPWGSAASHA